MIPPDFGRGLCALVVDDEEVVAMLVARLLEDVGFEVTTAADGVDGWHRLVAAASAPDLLVTNSRMPGMNGAELIVAARQRFPRLPIVHLTGADAASTLGAALIPPNVVTLYKPFDIGSFQRQVFLLLQATST